MGEVVNLNQYRKQRERLEREKEASANRVKFGRAKGEVWKSRHERDRNQAKLDGKRVERSDGSDDAPDTG